ncbi:MAG: hypothetical protein UV57_C0031G0001 [Parcubacteria group bacterium GW2011_GWD2_43_10]|uniref:CRISPR-associated endonuclease Cas2 n=2 Tax=Candidatus Vebleniibacteriota TaxID=1817921 RepID=A0A1G2Q2S8_9BACT|nr:MAG: hypothetical protein UV57_C0031G0001 [Parcubacteria group bacterium GW2011_GWD2_43_10]KKS92040.1 MAG: hypothetical protein UV69_C0039G0002 [Parcubacteria group bacterium GW2011_GWE2_43_12]KKT21792.1 MAG: hypothetical protein UW06_C0029G0003 [Parcubacteria group bacterium GW2011_GWE1_43_8]OHA54886.1 MAG: CRISPR-associated endonuclease Cas2 [Candidatus Veblenbacteria bacterium RIFOXYA2_FULL_43_9]OHA55990.1 MAG: CRISPR-associated endonuclease Cas2 [Candidatus Veblenbacteria bacterium RIFOX
MKKRIPASKFLLAALAKIGEATVDFNHLVSAVSSHYGRAYGKGGHTYVVELKRRQYEQDIKAKLRQLKINHYITAEKIGKRFLITLTKKGQATTIVQRLRSAKIMAKGWYTVVIFDIPVSQSWARKQFRQLLKEGGFFLLQQSVWASNGNVYTVVVDFVKQAKLDKWVNVYRATDFLYLPKRSNGPK